MCIGVQDVLVLEDEPYIFLFFIFFDSNIYVKWTQICVVYS